MLHKFFQKQLGRIEEIWFTITQWLTKITIKVNKLKLINRYTTNLLVSEVARLDQINPEDHVPGQEVHAADLVQRVAREVALVLGKYDDCYERSSILKILSLGAVLEAAVAHDAVAAGRDEAEVAQEEVVVAQEEVEVAQEEAEVDQTEAAQLCRNAVEADRLLHVDHVLAQGKYSFVAQITFNSIPLF